MLLIVITKRGFEISCECGRVLKTKDTVNLNVRYDLPESCPNCGLSPVGSFVRADKIKTPVPDAVISTLLPGVPGRAQGVPGGGVSAPPGFSLPDCADRRGFVGELCGLLDSQHGCVATILCGNCPKGWKA